MLGEKKGPVKLQDRILRIYSSIPVLTGLYCGQVDTKELETTFHRGEAGAMGAFGWIPTSGGSRAW